MYLLSKSNRILILSSKYKCLGSYNYEYKVKRSENSVQSGIIIDAWKYSFLQQHSRQISHSNSCLFTSIGQQTKYQKLDATKHEKSSSSSIVESKNRANDQISTHVSGVKRAKQAASDFSYTTIIAIGGVALVAMFYYLFSELFSRETPTGIYDESSKICSRNPEVIDALGQPIKVSAESGGRRVFQIKQKYIIENGVLCLLINYYLEGPRNKADVIVKVKKNESGKFEYDYIVVKLDHPHRGQYKINVKPEL